jgi:hypothetical protein
MRGAAPPAGQENAMQMLYNSDSYAIVAFELPNAGVPGVSADGYEIVDKFAGKETFVSGHLAESFKTGIDALIGEDEPSQEDIDDYIERFSALMQQPLVLH